MGGAIHIFRRSGLTVFKPLCERVVIYMTITNSIIQGIIQGLTEFLPVSSSGHLALFQYFTGQNGESAGMFTILLHMGTLLAVLIAFYKTIWGMLVELGLFFRDLFELKFNLREVAKRSTPNRRMILLLIISLVPMFLALYLMRYVDQISADNDIVIEGCCFVITSILLFLADSCSKGEKQAADMKYRDSVIVGVFQSVAVFPGISRSGSTISAGLMCGLDREYAVTFSFIMGIPTIIAANMLEFNGTSSLDMPFGTALIGVAAALVFGLLAIFLVKWLVKTERFKVFAWYTLIVGVLTIGVGVFERLTDHMIQELIFSMTSLVSLIQ